MKITAITKYKHGELYAILRRIGWSQSELARRCGLHPCRVGHIINLQRRPTQEQANAIQSALAEAGEYFDVLAQWPEAFESIPPGFERIETADIPMENLIGCREALRIPAPEQQHNGLMDALESSIDTLKPQQQHVIRGRFFRGMTLNDVGEFTGLTRERIRQIELKALRCLRHPARLKMLKDYRSPRDMPNQFPAVAIPAAPN